MTRTGGVDVADSEAWPTGVAGPARRALAGAGFTRLEQLTGVTEGELAQLHGMGPMAVRLLREALAAAGLAFRCADVDVPLDPHAIAAWDAVHDRPARDLPGFEV